MKMNKLINGNEMEELCTNMKHVKVEISEHFTWVGRIQNAL